MPHWHNERTERNAKEITHEGDPSADLQTPKPEMLSARSMSHPMMAVYLHKHFDAASLVRETRALKNNNGSICCAAISPKVAGHSR